MNKNNKVRMGSDLGNGITPFVVLSQPSTFLHNIYIQNHLESPEEMIAILDVLYSASKEDQVIIHLNSGGGAIDSLDTLLTAMASCKAHKHVIATGCIASSATFILLAADSFEISPYATLLFHTCTFAVWGQSQDNLEYTQFVHNENERLMRSYYRHIFTEDEIVDIIKNKRQFWMGAAEFEERFEKANKLLQAEDKVNQQQAEKEFEEQMFGPEIQFTKEQLVASKIKREDIAKAFFGEVDLVMVDGKITVVPVDLPENE